MPKVSLEAKMTIQELFRRGFSRSAIASALSVTEGAVRYHLRRLSGRAVDGRSRQAQKASGWSEAIGFWLSSRSRGWNLASLHGWLVSEHGYPGSLRSVERYVAREYPVPAVRARRRVETPPGGQAQADWAEYPGVLVGGEVVALRQFVMVLSHSRRAVAVWSVRKDLLSWLTVHNEALRRLGGVPATVRVDNERTVMSQGSGSWGTVHPVYRRYAESARFHVDVCAPRSPQAKGKVERRVGVLRFAFDPYGQDWPSLEALQAATDAALSPEDQRWRCPATGTTVFEAWQAELPHLGSLPELPEPFDLVAERRVGPDCTVSFEGRAYSVPFAWLGQAVEVRGAARHVVILAGGRVVARHERGTERRIVLDPAHFEGPATDRVLAPLPLGRMGRRLEEIAAMVPETRPLDLYAALAEGAR